MTRAKEIARNLFDSFTSLYDVDTEHDVAKIAAALEAYAKEERERYTTVYPASEYCEEYGTVLWWNFPVCEPPYVGNIDDVDGWPYFSRMPIVWDGDGAPLKIAARIREEKP